MTLRELAAATLLAALAALPGGARAYSDPLTFTDPVDIGGGGGRMFTGSVADGYGCDACHAGGATAPLSILGLPLSGYQTNTAYEVRVEWPATLERVALALELTDANGHAAGTLRLPPANELPDPERCEPVEDGVMAGTLTELDDGRTVLNVPDCGARRVRFLWTSPQTTQGVLRLSGGFVVSDGKADVWGDGTTEFARVLPPAHDADAAVTQITSGCAVVDARGAMSPFILASFAAATCLMRWRRRARAHRGLSLPAR